MNYSFREGGQGEGDNDESSQTKRRGSRAGGNNESSFLGRGQGEGDNGGGPCGTPPQISGLYH